jgi:hypothetical protein
VNAETIEVETRPDSIGGQLPRAFQWQGHRYRILSLGRRWEKDRRRWFLVQTVEEQTFELVNDLTDGSWALSRTPLDFGAKRPRV